MGGRCGPLLEAPPEGLPRVTSTRVLTPLPSRLLRSPLRRPGPVGQFTGPFSLTWVLPVDRTGAPLSPVPNLPGPLRPTVLGVTKRGRDVSINSSRSGKGRD